MKHLLITLVLLATSCGPDKAKEPAKPSDVFEALHALYQERIASYEAYTKDRSSAHDKVKLNVQPRRGM